jgi:starvation-inducible outer membrane lipoprotein
MRLVVLAMTFALTGCVTTPAQQENGCSDYDAGRLKGLKIGASMRAPDPATAQGQLILGEIMELQVRCGESK